MKYLVDTGILLRLINRQDARHEDVKGAVRRIRERGHQIATTTQNLREFWNVTTRPSSARGGLGKTAAQAARRLAALERIFHVLQESEQTFAIWKGFVSGAEVLGVQVHDANVAAIGIANGCSVLITLNPADFSRFMPLEVRTPAEVLAGEE
jgi:predicted nucleic acid-binding protein